MSVEEKLIRLAPPAFESMQAHPTTLIDLIEELYSADYFDSRIIYKGPVRFAVPVPRMLHIDEFTIWLLTDRYEHTALCDAVVAWRDNQELIGAEHGQGFAYATYQRPEAVSAIARGLGEYPKQELTDRFYSQADQFRQAAAVYIAGDQAILAYQRGFFELLHKFYREAAQQGEFVLHLIV
jgi:hypothetical protein